ncbi:hypothetical protein KEM56_006135 [Ascosphaera pollenicola]|nr:hypothetical protein KEM56_006135 [Ascosphaera pollenicola]
MAVTTRDTASANEANHLERDKKAEDCGRVLHYSLLTVDVFKQVLLLGFDNGHQLSPKAMKADERTAVLGYIFAGLIIAVIALRLILRKVRRHRWDVSDHFCQATGLVVVALIPIITLEISWGSVNSILPGTVEHNLTEKDLQRRVIGSKLTLASRSLKWSLAALFLIHIVMIPVEILRLPLAPEHTLQHRRLTMAYIEGFLECIIANGHIIYSLLHPDQLSMGFTNISQASTIGFVASERPSFETLYDEAAQKGFPDLSNKVVNAGKFDAELKERFGNKKVGS